LVDSEDGAPWNVSRPSVDMAALVLRSLGGPDRTPRLVTEFTANFDLLASGRVRLDPQKAGQVVTTVIEVMHRMAGPGGDGGAAGAENDLERLGAWLFRAGLGSRELRTVGHALVRAVRDGIDPAVWTTGVGSSWAAVQAWLVTALISGAQREAIVADRARQNPGVAPAGRLPPRGARTRRAR
jgi:hypothetical protein